MKTNVIVVTGGVYSSLGKGIIASSIGCILKTANFKVSMLKLDPYLNAFPGKLSPYQHGEVFVTEDGCEADLDLGHYERFTQVNQNCYSTTTSGKIYREILAAEENDEYGGKTIQVVPHVTDKIISKIEDSINKNKPDFLIVEIGGTVGDMESLPYIEALRLYNLKNKHHFLFVHASPLLQLEANNELKTKPTQHSIKLLRNLGISPNILILRNKNLIDDEDKQKLSMTCDIDFENIFVSKDAESLYMVPKILHEQKIENAIFNYFGITKKSTDMKEWNKFVESVVRQKTKKVNIGIYGLFDRLADSYMSLIESLKITGYQNDVGVQIDLLDSTKDYSEDIKNLDAVIMYGDICGNRHQKAQSFYKLCENEKIPFLGIGFGLEVMVHALLENVQNPVFIKNNSLRLGSIEHTINDTQSKAFEIYQTKKFSARHRDEFYFDSKYLNQLQEKVLISSLSTDKDKTFLEVIESKKDHLAAAVSFHPEYDVKPHHPHPLFSAFIKAALKK